MTIEAEKPPIETPPAIPPKETPPAPPTKDLPPPAPTTKEIEAATKKILSGEEPDDELEKHVDEKGYLTMPVKSLKTRISRANKAQLKEWFGVDTKEEARKKLDAYETAVKENEEHRRASLAENERLKEDAANERKLREVAEGKLAAAQEKRVVEEVQTEVLAVAKEYVDVGDRIAKRAVLQDFREHVRGLSKEDLKAFEKNKDGEVEAWFEDWAKENPKHAKPGEKEDKPKKEEPKKVPLTNGGKNPPKPSPAPAGGGSKSVKDMTEKELREYKLSKGIHG